MIGIEYIVLAGLLLRFILADQSFWLDEGASLVIARQSLPALISSLGADFHPPLFYFLTHFLLKLDLKNEVLLRLPNIFMGTATIYVTYLLVRSQVKKFGELAGLLAALFLALNPLHIYYSQELRMYAPAALLTVLSWYCLVLQGKKNYRFWFVIITTLNFYTYYGAFLNFAAQVVYLLWQERPTLKKFWPYLALPPLLFLPWLPTLFRQFAGAAFLQEALPGWRALSGAISPKALALIPIKFTLGRIDLVGSLTLKAAAALATAYFFLLIILARKASGAKLFFTWLIVPLLLALGLSIWSPMLGYWRYIFLLPAVAGIIGISLAQLKPPYRQVGIGLMILIFLLANITFWLKPKYQREDWRGVQQIDAHFNQLTTLYVFAFSDAFAPFRWYLPQAQYVAPLTELRSDPNALDSLLSQAVQGKSTILYFEYLAALTDPQGNIRRWFENAGYKLTKTHNLNGVGFIHEFHPLLLY